MDFLNQDQFKNNNNTANTLDFNRSNHRRGASQHIIQKKMTVIENSNSGDF
jgi:hypothetical protein